MALESGKTMEVLRADIKNTFEMACGFAAELNTQVLVAAAVVVLVSVCLLIAHYGNGLLLVSALLLAILAVAAGFATLKKEKARFLKHYEEQMGFLENLEMVLLKNVGDPEVEKILSANTPLELETPVVIGKLKKARYGLLGLSLLLLGMTPFFSGANANNPVPTQAPPAIGTATPTLVVSETPSTTDQQPTATVEDQQPTPTETEAVPTPTVVPKAEPTKVPVESTPTKSVAQPTKTVVH
jgi:hypothetical protein